jgi:hypothetical protein
MIGSRAADAPESRTAEAVNNDKRGVDLPIILASDVQMWAEANERQLGTTVRNLWVDGGQREWVVTAKNQGGSSGLARG